MGEDTLVREFRERPEFGCFATLCPQSGSMMFASKLLPFSRCICFNVAFADPQFGLQLLEYKEPTKFSNSLLMDALVEESPVSASPSPAEEKQDIQMAVVECASNLLGILQCLGKFVMCFGRCIYFNSVANRPADRRPALHWQDPCTPELDKIPTSSSPEE